MKLWAGAVAVISNSVAENTAIAQNVLVLFIEAFPFWAVSTTARVKFRRKQFRLS